MISLDQGQGLSKCFSIQTSWGVYVYECVCACVCLAIEVTWEDQQRGLNGSLSDGGTQPHPFLTDTGWLVWVWISVFHFDVLSMEY